MEETRSLAEKATDREKKALELLREAYSAQMNGELGNAVRLYQESIQCHPTAEAYTFLGWTYSSLQRYDEAIAYQQRAQELGLRIRPRMETETMVMALRLVADGVGDTFVPRAHTRAPYFPVGLTTVAFRPAVHETFATVHRAGARPSPATRAFVDTVVAHMTSPGIGLEPVTADGAARVQSRRGLR